MASYRPLRLLLCASLLWHLGAAAAAPPDAVHTVVAVTVNGQAKGDVIVFITAAGDYLMKPADLETIGVMGARGTRVEIDGEPHLALKSVAELAVRFDEKMLALDITAAPALLGKRVVDMLPGHRAHVLEPRDNSAFLNYRLDYAGGDAGGAFSFGTEMGLRVADSLLLSEFSHVGEAGQGGRTVRLMSNLTFDRRSDLQRLVVGDFFASSGELGSTLNLGGVSFSKRYSIDPYLVKQPMAGLVGAVGLPSEAEIYLDGMRVRTEKLPPGEFAIQNLNYYGGARDIEVVIKDRFGREQRIAYHYYFTDTLLREGLHEFSYDLGAQRRDFGLASNRYGGLAASAFHRYGFSDGLTAGLRGEARPGRFNFGPQMALRLGNWGTAAARVSFERDRDTGAERAAQIGYDYQAGAFNARLLARGFSAHYAPLTDVATTERPKSDISLGAGYGTPLLGNFGIDVTRSTKFEGTDQRSTTLSYSRSLPGGFNLFTTLGRVRDSGARTEFFLGLSYYPGRDDSAGYVRQQRNGVVSDSVQVARNVPLGEGWGYRLSAERQRAEAATTESVAPFLQYNGRYGIYTADYRSDSTAGSHSASYQLAAAGSLGYVGGTLGFSRPIQDSFGVVRVGEIEGVRVYHNSQLVGRTDAAGAVFIPSLGSYIENQITIADKDIPMEYELSGTERLVSPPLRSGSLVSFAVARIRAFTGVLKLRAAGQTKVLEYNEVTLLQDGQPLAFPTGKGGEFYLENLPPGRYPASFVREGKTCRFDLSIPASQETVVALGEVICEMH